VCEKSVQVSYNKEMPCTVHGPRESVTNNNNTRHFNAPAQTNALSFWLKKVAQYIIQRRYLPWPPSSLPSPFVVAVAVAVAASLMVCCCDTTEHKEGDNQLGASRPLLGLLHPLECTRRLPHHFPCRRHLPHLLPCQRQQTNDTRCIKHHQKHKRQQPTQKHFLSGSKKANNSITYHGWLHWCRHSSRRLPRLRRRVLSCWFVVRCCVERCVP